MKLRVFSFITPIAFLTCLVGCSSRTQQPAALTPEGKAYTQHLELSGVELNSTESFAKQTLTEIEGNIKNSGDRTVNRVEVTCLFYDADNHLVLRERAVMVRNSLKPGETHRFRLAFDDVPDSWNNKMPQLVIAQVLFG